MKLFCFMLKSLDFNFDILFIYLFFRYLFIFAGGGVCLWGWGMGGRRGKCFSYLNTATKGTLAGTTSTECTLSCIVMYFICFVTMNKIQ